MNLEQVAVFCETEEKLREIQVQLTALGISDWIEDRVKVKNLLDPDEPVDEALLCFNYNLIKGIEFELITYTLEGRSGGSSNWLAEREFAEEMPPFLSHFGKHVDSIEDEIDSGKYPYIIAQYVQTIQHENPGLGNKKFKYLIFDSHKQIGFDLKLIERVKDGTV